MNISKTMKWVGILLLPLSLSAGTVTWQKGSDGKWNGDWSDKSHWSSGELPTAADKVVFPAEGATITITVNDTYTIGSLDMDGTGGAAEQRCEFCLSGTGTINLAGSDGKGFSTWVRDRRALTLDGVSMVDTGWQDLMIRGRITVKNGALLKNTRLAKFAFTDSEYIIDGGRFEFSELTFIGTSGTGASWPMRFVLNSGTVSGGYVYPSGTTSPYAIEINGGSMSVTSFLKTLNNGSKFQMSGGALTVNGDFTVGTGAEMALSGGTLTVKNVDNVAPDAVVSVTGGTLCLSKVTEDMRFAANKTLTLKYDLGSSAFTKSGSVPVVADTIRLGQFRTDTDAGSVLHGKFRNIVFTTGDEPFRFGNSSQRNFYLEGPTTIRAVDSQKDNLGSTWYTYLKGDFTVDTTDANDGVAGRHISLWSSASDLGSASLTVRGKGSLCLLQHDSCSTFRFIDVQAGATLNLSKRGNGFEWGPVSAERFSLGANAKVTLDAKYNHIVAKTFEIDPTATIEVTIGDAPTCGAFAILQSPDGTTPSAAYMSQVVLKGATDGWSLKAADGQVMLYKAGTVTGDYPTEWVGKGADDKVGTLANFYSALPTEKVPVYFGADETRLTASWRGPLGDGGYTLGGLCFLESAISTFGYTSSGETGTIEPLLDNASGVPQKHLNGSWRTSRVHVRTRGHGPMVFEGSTTGWGENYSGENYWQWRNRGDCRIAKPLFNMRDFVFYGLDTGYGNYSRFTVLNGSTVDVQDLYTQLSGRATGFRVVAGGLLKFTDTLATSKKGARFYQWTSQPAKHVVDGTMDIQIPFKGGASQAYGGAGTLKLANTVPALAASRVWLQDTLTTELAADWETVTAAADTPLALGALAGNPVIKVADGWRYGTGTGAETATTADARAIEVCEGATLTVDAAGGTAIVAEAVSGVGTLAASNGTLRLAAAMVSEATLAAKDDAAIEIAADMTVAALDLESGSTLAVRKGHPLTVSAPVSVAGVRIAFDSLELADKWQDVVSAPEITGTPVLPGGVRFRIVEGESGMTLQCGVTPGCILLLR